jgi:hypothetical protein
METTPREEAIAWLAGQLRFERLLDDLHRRSEAAGGPVDLAVAGERDVRVPQAA